MPSGGQSPARQPQQKYEEPITVLVTGFGPFLDKYPQNSSWGIASTLPALILPSATCSHPPIRILVHHHGVRVAYNPVFNLVPTLLSPPASAASLPAPDIVLHIGLAAGRSFYTMEKLARGRGYGKFPDVDGIRFLDKKAEQRWPSDEFPTLLKTGFHTEDVYSRWRSQFPESDPRFDLRESEDAGNFLCEFIYWNSLAHFWNKQDGKRPVMFLHVPDLPTEEKLEVGRQVTIALIRALAESHKALGAKDEGPENVGVGHRAAQVERARAQLEDKISGAPLKN